MEANAGLKEAVNTEAQENLKTFDKYFNEFGKEDPRSEYFSAIYQLHIWLGVQLNLWPLHRENAEALGVSKNNIEIFLSQSRTITMASYIVAFCFDCEILLKRICEGLGATPPSGFYNVCTLISDNIKGGWDFTRLYDLSLIRNSRHNNGFYYGYNENHTLQLDCRTVTVSKGQQFEVSWGDLIFLMSGSRSQMLDLLNRSEIKEIYTVP